MVKFQLLEVGTMEPLRDYESLEAAIADLRFKAPEQFWVGDLDSRTAYTIPKFFELYVKKV